MNASLKPTHAPMSPVRDRYISNCYVDKRHSIWFLPLSALAILWMTGVMGMSIYWISIEDFGDNTSKQKTLLVLASVFLLFAIYACIGVYQFFAEMRRQFIARKVERWSDDIYRLRGYYFKKAAFNSSEVASVTEHIVKPRFGKNIATALTWTRPNYKLTLHDGREFYLPGELDRIEDLVALLKGQ